MEIEATAIAGVRLIRPVVHGDTRGFFLETWHADRYAEAGIDLPFVQDNHSRSTQGILRGLHLQTEKPQGKLVRVVHGEIFDVAVDVRPDSPTFGEWAAVSLSATNRRQLWVPPGFVHGFCVLTDGAEVLYKCSELYDPGDEIGVRWDDPDLGIEWPIAEPAVSDKDAALPRLAELRPRLEAAPAYRYPKAPSQR